MENIFLKIHSQQFVEGTLDRIKSILFDLYGTDRGEVNYSYLVKASADFLRSLSAEDIDRLKKYDPAKPYEHLKGKIFAISYPDNIYNDTEPTLNTLSAVLKKYFPGINGIHILPEREMSHGDIWPQDFHDFLESEQALSLVVFLQKESIIDENRFLSDSYGERREEIIQNILPLWLKQSGLEENSGTKEKITALMDMAYNSHFNDGGFSQKTRAKIDSRFGTLRDLKKITSSFAVMLDYVVNHLDIDNEYLERYRRGEDTGEAFIIVTPAEYEEMKVNGEISKTFRPRPFPLYTGVRKYPAEEYNSSESKVRKMNELFREVQLTPMDERVILFFSIYFKVRNDQGLTAEDTRIFKVFSRYLQKNNIPEERVFTRSALQPSGKMFTAQASAGLAQFAEILGIDRRYADVFAHHDDEIFGEKFFIYTTFSESQADINPVTEAGFRMIIDDLFHLLSSGRLAMMRMDAIKYLWKERGKKNFDMEEGNKLIEVIRRVMQLTAPGVLPLDEVNSPDTVVYEMEKEGGFAYLFGQVNSTVSAFNEGTLGPLENYYRLFKKKGPDNFVPFIMLSTHDGRSVQGLGVQRTDGHVSISQFYRLKDVIEKQGGRAKYRSVPAGEIAMDTFDKVVEEADLIEFKEELLTLFNSGSAVQGETLVLKKEYTDREKLITRISEITGIDIETLSDIPAVDYFLDWITDGKTIYELCATSRSAFKKNQEENDVYGDGAVLEARRLALAQLFVLTFGQAVPAIYFNDLLGLINDEAGYRLSGKPRDLNRHKTYLSELESAVNKDSFLKEYLPLINKILDLRTKDNSFYPGSRNFEFIPLTDQVFLNHSFFKGDHSFVIGNISSRYKEVKVDFSKLAGLSPSHSGVMNLKLKDLFSWNIILSDNERIVSLKLEPFEKLWLKFEE